MSDARVQTVSTLLRVKHAGSRETVTTLLEADNMSVREDAETGEAIVELFRYGANERALESFQMRFCALDRARLKTLL